MQSQSQIRYSEPDNRDWRGRSGQLSSAGEERSWDKIHDNNESYPPNTRQQEQFNGQDQLSSQFSSRVQVSSSQVVITNILISSSRLLCLFFSYPLKPPKNPPPLLSVGLGKA